MLPEVLQEFIKENIFAILSKEVVEIDKGIESQHFVSVYLYEPDQRRPEIYWLRLDKEFAGMSMHDYVCVNEFGEQQPYILV